MKNTLLLLLSIAFLSQTAAQPLTLHLQPVFYQKNIVLNESLLNPQGDSLTLYTLRFYLSNFAFLSNGALVFEEKNSCHLLDLEEENTLDLHFDLPAGTSFDEVKFDLGTDSLTNVSGAMGGDLDPTKGMFWTWQSGYINFKIEGFSAKCFARNHEFQFHLGGFLLPFQSVQSLRLPVPTGKNLRLQLDLTPFFENVDWAKKHSIMSPSGEAVALSKILAKSFSLYAE